MAETVLKWVGSKRWLAPSLAPVIRGALEQTGGLYVEPFLGGGAVALGVSRRRMILSDMCGPLVDFFSAVRDSPDEVSEALRAFVAFGTDEIAYFAVRQIETHDLAAAAGKFLYLNKLAFNGIYRVNRGGVFNVPYNKRPGTNFPTSSQVRAMSRALAGASLLTRDFHDAVDETRPGDVVFADPPYVASFSQYTDVGFDAGDHLVLAELLRDAAERGVTVMATNADTKEVRGMYEWAHVGSVVERHAVGASPASRGLVGGLLITSDASMLSDLRVVSPPVAVPEARPPSS